MTDPERLAEGGDLGAALLRAGRALDVVDARERKRALLGAASTVVAAGMLFARLTSKRLLGVAIGKWMVLGVLVTGTVAVPVVRAFAPADPPVRSAGDPRRPPPVTRVGEPEAPRAAPERPPEEPLEPGIAPPPGASSLHEGKPEGARSPPREVARRVQGEAAPPPQAEARAAAPEPDGAQSLAAEVASLRRVRAALGAGQPGRALSVLDEHAQRFAGGKLGIEAELLRIEALTLAGAGGAARARAERFLALHPDSPYAQRMRVHLGTGGDAGPSNP